MSDVPYSFWLGAEMMPRMVRYRWRGLTQAELEANQAQNPYALMPLMTQPTAPPPNPLDGVRLWDNSDD